MIQQDRLSKVLLDSCEDLQLMVLRAKYFFKRQQKMQDPIIKIVAINNAAIIMMLSTVREGCASAARREIVVYLSA